MIDLTDVAIQRVTSHNDSNRLVKVPRGEIKTMDPQIDPLTSLAGRCSGPAWDRLKELRQHALFGLLIRALNAIDGTILDVHVDRVCTELLKHEYNQEKPATTPLH